MSNNFNLFDFQPDDLADLISEVVDNTLCTKGPTYTRVVAVHGSKKNRVEDYIEREFKPYLNHHIYRILPDTEEYNDQVKFTMINESYFSAEEDGWVHEWYIVGRRK